jgi:hypothetical protein
LRELAPPSTSTASTSTSSGANARLHRDADHADDDVEDDNDDEDEDDEDDDGKADGGGVYRAPRINPMPFTDDRRAKVRTLTSLFCCVIRKKHTNTNTQRQHRKQKGCTRRRARERAHRIVATGQVRAFVDRRRVC